MSDFFRRHRALLGYGFIVLVAVLAVELHLRAVNTDLRTHDKRSCEQRNAIAANQVIVIRTLIPLLEAELRESIRQDRTLHPALARLWVTREDELLGALKSAGPRIC